MGQVIELLADHTVADSYSHFAARREAPPLCRGQRLGSEAQGWKMVR